MLRAKTGTGSLGRVNLAQENGVLRVASPTMIGSPVYKAGVDRGDEILSVAGTTLATPDDVTKALAGRKAGDKVEIVSRRRGQEVRSTITLAEPVELELVPVEQTGTAVTAEQTRFRQAWLQSKVK